MTNEIILQTPLSDEEISKLKSGDRVLLSGKIYTARDTAHKRLIKMLDDGEKLPFDIKGQVIYYVGPSPTAPGKIIGSCGPTTSYRMDPYAPKLLDLGLKGMIGKGMRSKEVKESIVKNKAVYFAAIGGAGALISKCVKKVEIILFEDLGPEAVRLMEVENLPLFVVNDTHGNDMYEQEIEKYKRAL